MWTKTKIKEVRKGIVKGELQTDEQLAMLNDLGINYLKHSEHDESEIDRIQYLIDRKLQAMSRKLKRARA